MSLPAGPAITSEEADHIVAELLTRLMPSAAAAGDGDAAQRRIALAHVLTTRPPEPFSPDETVMLDRLLAAESAMRPTTDAGDLPRVRAAGPGTRISLWQGDITTLRVDAIVNAANNQMLGCFVPGHACIDNVIHAVAGPQLRAECAAHMAQQGHLEPTGTATLTGGYHLPSRHVLHTVGPIVPTYRPTDDDARALAACYRSCLDKASTSGNITSVAFCAVSTGVFGYPITDAAAVAIDTVSSWLDERPDDPMHVVFNTYSDRDTAVYRSTLEGRLP